MNYKERHRCDQYCICPIHETQLFYSRKFNTHACQDRECRHAHGMNKEAKVKAIFFMGPKDGTEEEVQTSNGFAPKLYQHDWTPPNSDALKPVISYYDLQEVKEGIAHYKYRCTA